MIQLVRIANTGLELSPFEDDCESSDDMAQGDGAEDVMLLSTDFTLLNSAETKPEGDDVILLP